jgi:acyl carrier protein
MINFIELVNMVAAASRPAFASDGVASSMDNALADIGINSLDSLVMTMYLCELYGIDDTTTREWHPMTVQDVYDLVMARKTREPESLESAREQIK